MHAKKNIPSKNLSALFRFILNGSKITPTIQLRKLGNKKRDVLVVTSSFPALIHDIFSDVLLFNSTWPPGPGGTKPG